MYSVQDLLISHGYKLPGKAPSPCEGHQADWRREIAGNRSGHGTANGYETDTGAYVCGGQPLAKGYSSDNECRERNQRRKAGSGYQGDTQSLGDSLATDSGFYDDPRSLSSQRDGRDVSYWRRRGQDFSILLDFGDRRDPRGSSFSKAGMPPDGLGHERQRWDDGARLRDGEQRMVIEDRKCQSLGTEDWQPAVDLGRQLSDGEGERWAREQQRILVPGGDTHPGTRGKSQSLPRVLSPERAQYPEMPVWGPISFTGLRVIGSQSQGPSRRFHIELSSRDAPKSLLPIPRLSRPLKPPSYEAHQQTRGSLEMLAGDMGVQPRDKALHSQRVSGGSRPDYFAQEPTGSNAGPPVYIPPPSYKRPLLQKGNQKMSGEILSNSMWKGEPFQQGGKWSSRQAGNSWLDYQRDRSAQVRKKICPGYTEEHVGCVQYIPFDDPRVRHISGGLCGNSLTYPDNIRSISEELPRATVFEQSSHNSAFLPPKGHYINMDTDKRSNSEQDNENRRLSGVHKASDNSTASDQSCNKYQKDRSYTAFQNISSQQNANLNQGFCETVTQVKKIEPCPELEKSSKRKFTETIFCLVSVPIHSQSNGELSDQNNNKRVPDPVGGSTENNRSHVQNQSLLSTSSSELERRPLTGGALSLKGRKRPSYRRPILQLNKCRELQYPGSWPGDQYRDQETQTSSPEVSKGPPQVPPNQQAQDQGNAAPDTTTDSSISTDCSNRFSYPMKGQKSLNPSSNSAFSRTANFSNQLIKNKTQQPQFSGSQEEADYLPAQKSDKPAAGSGPEVFGQFLLKPVSRRPGDAIEELESFNKELQEQFGQTPSVDQCIENLDEAYRNILELSKTSTNVESPLLTVLDDNKGTSLSDEFPNANNKTAFRSWTSATDSEYREVRSAFSRPVGKAVSFNRLQREEAPVVSEAGLPDQNATTHILQNVQGDRKALKPDITVPSESLLKDVGLTVYTEAPGAPRQLMQDASTLTSPPDYEDVCQALQMSREKPVPKEKKENKFRSLSTGPLTTLKSAGYCSAGSTLESSFSKAVRGRKSKKGNSLPKFSGEKSVNVIMVKRQFDRFYNRGGTRCIVDDVPDDDINDVTAPDNTSEHFDWRKQLSLAEKHLETLLLKEKVNSVPAEDLSKLYEVKCAEGIPENESIEERAARILGIDVPAESLGVVDRREGKQAEEPKTENDSEHLGSKSPECANGKQMHVSDQCEEVSEASISDMRQEGETADEMETSKDNNLSKDNGNCVGKKPGAAEGPENKPVLSVRTNADEGCKGLSTSRMIEALQGRLGASSCKVAADRLARMKEVDSVSRMRRLNFRSLDSGEEPEDEARAGASMLEQSQPARPQPQSRNTTPAIKRALTLPRGFSMSSKRTELQDGDPQPPSDSYDPSLVERV
ncbi:junctional protein associated with coronary artery disease homolog [Brienomyrus brachyistius]|uniref:junctional protein associated with coronary artery disease homolog n=1 Tax=Brienomyrus brachyistius TaxID=42636 RepID=UPI0020B43AD8|nr:junctional protein associated with coronary artery disease homolog [Brienomyrus brachyistius]XP_048871855.1 junctional protein associated with coronary artery disease homolog [Brienomyrus brachyistius]XP_048871861.1 junctional protein associated with coronary artery disease homolog [Brienomyrus brachyistius]XP_048871867.1 junctional protein associated with coronary artery disease homolog [Brienomyrus brachyistius]XP_048871869.1 junctional protein associated with coronary artery disease homol